MKRFLRYLFPALVATPAAAQLPDSSRTFVAGYLGVISHQQSVSSVNGNITAPNSAAILAEILVERSLDRARIHRVQGSLSLANFTFRYLSQVQNTTNEPLTLGGSTTGSGSGYFKLYLGYGIAVTRWRAFEGLLTAGPCLMRQNTLGYWSSGSAWVGDTSATAPANTLFEVRDSISKSRRLSAGLNLGLDLRLRFSPSLWMLFSPTYQFGFHDVNRQDVTAHLDRIQVDRAVISSRLSGFIFRLGLGLSIRKRSKKV